MERTKKLTNTTKGDLGLDPETIVPAMGVLEIENDVLTAHKANPIVKYWLVTGALVESGAEDAPIVQGPSDDRLAVISGIIRGLGAEGFTKGGKPEVDAINAALPASSERVAAAERDAAWAVVEAERAA